MTVVVTLDSGESHRLDRNLIASRVAERINAARGDDELIPFESNDTPSRTIYIDPDHVIMVKDDGFAY